VQAQPKTGTILDRIVEARRAAVEHRQKVVPLPVLKLAVKRNEPARDFAGAISQDKLNVIAELKKASPSRGVLREDFSVETLAAGFEQAGAAALSVLTEEQFFQGALANVTIARKKTALPVLRKDFIFNAWQVWETRAAEADSFLMIAAILDDSLLRDLLALGRELGMEALVEVHSREELQRAVEVGARIVGVNNRDLRTFEVRVETSLELIEEIPDACIAVSESGLRTHEDIARLRAAGFDAFLIGEQLMQAAEPEVALRKLLGT
jgi:indole-3-glycerol phosphate synthase